MKDAVAAPQSAAVVGQETAPLRADLLLEGGGVKALGLVGAVGALAAHGYAFPRIAGTSAGAIVGAVVAALQRAGEPLTRLEDVARTLDHPRLRDRGLLGRFAGPLTTVADGLSLAFDGGIFEGEYLRRWLEGVLADLGVRTFGDLPAGPDVAAAGGAADGSATAAAPVRAPDAERWSLVVTASDLSRRRLVRLPWDYPLYGLDPDEQSVADAVRASSSIPFVYEPVTLRAHGAVSTLVDGTILSAFPVDIFERSDQAEPRWPTFGVRLSSRPGREMTQVVQGPISLALAVVETLVEACDAQHIHDPLVQARTIFVDTSGSAALAFTLTGEDQLLLLERGRRAAGQFLAGWDWPGYLERLRTSHE